jgi:hypothetical protein
MGLGSRAGRHRHSRSTQTRIPSSRSMVCLPMETLPTAHRLQPLHASENDWLLHKAPSCRGSCCCCHLHQPFGHIWQRALSHGGQVTFGTVPENKVECHGCLRMRRSNSWVDFTLLRGLKLHARYICALNSVGRVHHDADGGILEVWYPCLLLAL